MLNLKHKITKRLHPLPLIKYDLRKNWRGFRKQGDIDCHMADHVHVYMTLKCQNSCRFCINNMLSESGKPVTYREVKDPDKWLWWLNRLQNTRELYFNGGEHFNLPYFPEVINNLRGFNLNVFTNLPRKGLPGIRRLQKNNNNLILRCSFHPLSDEPINMFVDRYRQIPEGVLSSVIIIRDYGIGGEVYISGFDKYGIHATSADLVEPDISGMESHGKVMCNSMEHIIGPDLRVFRCVYKLVHGIEGVPIRDYEFNFRVEACGLYPKCFAASSPYARVEI